MDNEILMNHLKSKSDLNLIIDEAIKDPTILNSLMSMVPTETSSLKYACTKIIRKVSEQKPELVYPYFENIAKWLLHKNSFIKWDGILTLSNLSSVDNEDKFKVVYEEYFALIQDPQMITAANVAGNAWKIVLAKPELEDEITRRLLEVPNITYYHKGEPSPECNRIVCGKVLECFDHYYDYSKNQSAMLQFAEEQQYSHRRSVVIITEKFLKKHSC